MALDLPERLFTAHQRDRLNRLATVPHPDPLDEVDSASARRRLAHAEVLLTGWGAPRIDAAFLAAAPHLRAIVHAAGSVRPHIDPACFVAGIAVSSAAHVNARPVAEYTVAMILLANKGARKLERQYRDARARVDVCADPGIGNRDKTVGIVGASRTGRRVMGLLEPFDLELVVHDPYLTDDDAARLPAEPVPLDELLRRSDVVSLHAPDVPSTHRLIDARRLGLLREGATLINTARGSLMDHDALIAELRTGRIEAVLDVTDPEPLPADSPLFSLPNVTLTPHIAGALGTEVHALADAALDEVARLRDGRPLLHAVHAADLDRSG